MGLIVVIFMLLFSLAMLIFSNQPIEYRLMGLVIFSIPALLVFLMDWARKDTKLDTYSPEMGELRIDNSIPLILVLLIPYWVIVGGIIFLLSHSLSSGYGMLVLLSIMVNGIAWMIIRRPAYVLTPQGIHVNGWISEQFIPWQSIVDIKLEDWSKYQIVAFVTARHQRPDRKHYGQFFFLHGTQQQLLDVCNRWHTYYSGHS